MQMHALAGSRDLLVPEFPDPVALARLIGRNIRIPGAAWLIPDAAPGSHDFLLDEPGDRRVEVFAQSLKDGFGTRFEPLVILPGLLDREQDATARRKPLDVLVGIWKAHPAERLDLHALALPAGVDPDGVWAAEAGLLAPQAHARLEDLASRCIDAGVRSGAIEATVTEVSPEQPVFPVILRNAVTAQVVERIGAKTAREGLAAAPAGLAGAVSGVLQAWAQAGLGPAAALGGADFERIADRVLAAILTAREPADG
jgi:hypothetical protein